NNPSSYTDPSGYFSLRGAIFGGILGAINPELAGKLYSFAAPFLNFIPGCQVWCAAIASTVGGYLQTGSVSAGLRAGTLAAVGSAIGIGAGEIGGFGGVFVAGIGG